MYLSQDKPNFACYSFTCDIQVHFKFSILAECFN